MNEIPPPKPGEVDLPAEINAFVEYYWNRMKEAPSMERLKNEFPGVDSKALESQLKKGLDRLTQRGYQIEKRNYLSPKQLALANALLNLNDRRSNKKKLEDCKVSPAEYANWRKSAVFNDYLRERSEEVLQGGITEAHMALVDSASSGDMSAIKLLYEITGRHSPNSQQNVNIKTMLVRVIEAVQRHVTDPATLQAIAADIQMASEGMLDAGPAQMGTLEPNVMVSQPNIPGRGRKAITQEVRII